MNRTETESLYSTIIDLGVEARADDVSVQKIADAIVEIANHTDMTVGTHEDDVVVKIKSPLISESSLVGYYGMNAVIEKILDYGVYFCFNPRKPTESREGFLVVNLSSIFDLEESSLRDAKRIFEELAREFARPVLMGDDFTKVRDVKLLNSAARFDLIDRLNEEHIYDCMVKVAKTHPDWHIEPTEAYRCDELRWAVQESMTFAGMGCDFDMDNIEALYEKYREN